MDWKWTVTAVLPVVTLVLGALLNQWTAAKLEQAQLRRELKARKAEREQARLDRREEFELTQLTDVLTALRQLTTTTAAFWKHLTSSEDIPPESKEAFQEAHRKLKSLVALTLDDDIRDAVDTAYDTANLLHLGEPIQHGMPSKTVPQALHDIGRAEYVVASRVREIYKSDHLPASPQAPAVPGST
ncbi:hypothetical protein [Streptomyces chartreusis]|uniref:hypothetical protein n=1 Tax=Streptomyces chartreusis TaxID=1969 RepID=UPI0013CE891F|nr:hypothetical protein [Streptomyces chartreusis]